MNKLLLTFIGCCALSLSSFAATAQPTTPPSAEKLAQTFYWYQDNYRGNHYRDRHYDNRYYDDRYYRDRSYDRRGNRYGNQKGWMWQNKRWCKRNPQACGQNMIDWCHQYPRQCQQMRRDDWCRKNPGSCR